MKWIKEVAFCWVICLVIIIQAPLAVAETDLASPGGTVVITVSNVANLGYLGYAQTLSQIVRAAFPERKIQIIAEVFRAEAENVKLFRFHDDDCTELLVIPYGFRNHEERQEQVKLANHWLSEAGHILRVNFIIGLEYPFHLQSKTYSFQQIWGSTLDESSNQQLFEYLEEFQSIVRSVKAPEETIWPLYWRQHSSCVAEAVSDENQTIESAHAQCKESKALLKAERNTFKLPEMMLKTFYSMGLGAGQYMPVLPEFYNVSQQDDSSFRQSYKNLKQHYPGLGEILGSSTNGFYMSYIHNPIKLAEFIVMAALIDGDQDTLVLATGKGRRLEDEISQYLFSEYRIGKIELIDLTRQEETMIKVFNKNTYADYQKMVRVVVLPKINDPSEYLSLFYYSHPVVGATGNSTLFNALAMGKLPFYAPHLDVQFLVNEQLAQQEASSPLAPFFSNLLRPEEKADIVRQYSTLIPDWAARIVQKKSLNQHLIEAVR